LVEEAKNIAELEAICRNCELCPLAETRQNVVFGEGSGQAGIFLLGEAPGAKEDQIGRPFVGRAGNILNRALDQSGLIREDVFITGSVKCRPPRNRNPHQGEIEACRAFLERQLTLLRPKIVICMGLVSIRNLLGLHSRLAEIRGRFFETPSFRVLPTYHPAAILRGTADASCLAEDFKTAAFEVKLNQ